MHVYNVPRAVTCDVLILSLTPYRYAQDIHDSWLPEKKLGRVKLGNFFLLNKSTKHSHLHCT